MDVGEAEPWTRLVDTGAARLVGFEPYDDECKNLTAAGRPNTEYLPHALGDGGSHTLHVVAAPMTSSLFAPDPSVMQQFHSLW